MISEKLTFPTYLQENPAFKRYQYKNQDAIYQQGEALSNVLIVQQGYVKLHRLSIEGRQVTLSILGTNAVFGVLENPQKNAAEFASAQGNVILYQVNLTHFEWLLTNDNRFSQFIIYILSRQQNSLQNRLFFTMNRKVESRLAALLCELATNASERCIHGGEIDLTVTQQDIADMIGASRQVVSSLLNRWRKQDIVHYWRDGLCLLDLAELKLLAEK